MLALSKLLGENNMFRKDIPKNSRGEVIRVEADEFKGKKQLNIRTWYIAEDGELRPGKAGIAINLDILADVFPAIVEACKELLPETVQEEAAPKKAAKGKKVA